MKGKQARRFAPMAAVPLLALTVLAACGSSGSSKAKGGTTATTAAAGPKVGGHITYATAEVPSLDPLKLGEGSTGNDRGIQIYDTLLKLDAKGNILPSMALSMDSTDGMTWTMKLRPGVKFTDGTPYDADAVVYNIKRQADPANKFAFGGNVSDATEITAVDPTTVKFVLKAPNGSFPLGFTTLNGLIASPTALKADPTGFGNKPVGAGPFMVKEYVRDDHLELVRNPDYWDKPKPYLDGITVKIIQDPLVMSQALIANNVQAIIGTGISLAAVKGNNDIKQIGGIDTGGEAVAIQSSKKPGNDIRFRQAIALAFDPNVVDQVITKGAWTDKVLLCPPFTKDSPECLPNVWPKADIPKAKQLIQAWLADGNNKSVTLLAIQGNTSNEFIQQQLNAIGLDVKINTLPTADYVAKLNGGDFDIAWSAMTSFSSPYPKLFQYFHSKGGRAIPKANNPDLDKAIEKARDGLTPDARVAGYKDFQQIMDTQYYYVWYSPYINGLLIRNNVNVGPQAAGTNYHMAEFYLS